ncbi:MAG: isoprenylcysteine carboxylmethyltransferase family protein [Bacteroidota bacterium]
MTHRSSLFIRNLIFTILQPGVVVGLIPYLLLRSQIERILPDSWKVTTIAGALLFLVGLVIMIACIRSFALQGKGTISPIDPTRELVSSGLYRFSRNPMYVGVMLQLIGLALYFGSNRLWLYLLLVFLAFNLFIVLIEEPRLRRDFGESYIRYCEKVGRWL